VAVEKKENSAKIPLYLIDSYALIYRSYFAFLTRPLRNGKDENISALFGFAKLIVTLLNGEAVGRDIRLAAVFDSSCPTFRHKKYPLYKATREKAPQDLHAQVPKVEAFLNALGIAVLRADGFEADDIIATLAVRCRNEGRECYIISSDKDLLQLVGGGVFELRQTKSNTRQIFEKIGPEEVKSEWGVSPEKILDLLSLAGDVSDNIPGVKGIGEKTAVKLLLRYGSLDKIYENIAGIEGAVGKRLAADRPNAYLSHELISLVCDVPIQVNEIDDFSLENINRSAGADVLLREGIPSIARQLNAGETAVQERQTPEDSAGTNAAQKDFPHGAEYQIELQNAFLPLNSPPRELTGSGCYRLVTDSNELEDLFARALSQGYMALDFETDSLDAWHANPVGVSFALKPKEAFYVPLVKHGGEDEFLAPEIFRAMLAPLLSDENFTIIAHNAKYDYAVSRGWGIERWSVKIWDTMIAAWICDTGRAGYSLDSLALSYLEYSALSYANVVPKGKTLADVPADVACRYSAEDADLCLRMRLLLEPRLNEFGEFKLFTDIEMPLLPILAEMEGAGIKIEGSALKKYGVELGIHLNEIEAEIWRLVGHQFNIASPKQLQDVLFVERGLKPIKKTKTGWSTDVAVLGELAREDRVPELILQHRTVAKLKSTYVDTLAGMADSHGRLHTSFIQTGTATGRLSSRDPNLQNIPIRDEAGRRIREAFVSREGCVLISADYSQIELVILAHLSQDKNLVEAFNEGKDVHTKTASLIFGINENKVDASQRRIAKIINFGVMYGMSAFRLSNELKIGRREAVDFIDAYFNTYSGIRDFIRNLIARTEKQGYVSTLFGRRRAIPAINSPNKTEKAAAERIAVNTPIQGTAADIVKKAMIDLDRALTESGETGARMLLQVHDELILECPEDKAQKTAALIRTVMENAVQLSVPLRVSVETGGRWGDFH
jgi:DNA polymerase-1